VDLKSGRRSRLELAHSLLVARGGGWGEKEHLHPHKFFARLTGSECL
jgi:hypothetical protein